MTIKSLSSQERDLERVHLPLTTTLLPDGSAITTIYDTTGGVQSNGKVKAVSFDRGIISYDYNYATGQVTSVTAPGGNSITYQYDGSLTTAEIISGEVNGKISVAYNNDFAPASQTVNDSLTVTFAYDKDGLMTRAGDLHITYDPENGLPVSDSLMGVETEYVQNSYGEVTDFTASYLNNLIYSYNFIRDDLGRITRKIETLGATTITYNYQYDSTGRLTKVWKDDLIISEYVYDSNGNRIAHIQGSDTIRAVYDAQDRLISYGGIEYFYNSNGYLNTQISNLDTTRYTYDDFGNLISVRLPDGKLIEYLIDANHRRIGKKVDGVVVRKWLYGNGLLPTAELDTADNIKILYIPGGFIKDGVTFRLIYDHLSSIRQIVNVSTGEIVLSNIYDEFGKVAEQSGDSAWTSFDLGFGSGIYDLDTKLIRFGARDYDPEIGRWNAKDPILFEGGDPNLYGYVLNDPVNDVDPEGTFSGMVQLMLTTASYAAAAYDFLEPLEDIMDAADVIMTAHLDVTNYNVENAIFESTVGAGLIIAAFINGVDLEKHHIFPKDRQLRPYFDQAKIKINKFTVPIPSNYHHWLHSTKGFNWNQRWLDFFTKNPSPSKMAVYRQAVLLLSNAGFTGIKRISYWSKIF